MEGMLELKKTFIIYKFFYNALEEPEKTDSEVSLCESTETIETADSTVPVFCMFSHDFSSDQSTCGRKDEGYPDRLV